MGLASNGHTDVANERKTMLSALKKKREKEEVERWLRSRTLKRQTSAGDTER